MRIEIGALFGRHSIQRIGGFGGGFQRGAEVERVALVAGLVHEQHAARFGAFDREVEAIVIGQVVGGIDADLAAIQAEGEIRRQEFDGGASTGGNIDGFGIDLAAIQHQGDAALGLFGSVARDGGLDACFAGAINSARRVDALDGEIGGAPIGHGMRDQPHAVAQAQVREVGGQRRFLHVGEQVRLDGHAGRLSAV